jgi:hypothetical protein
MPDPGLSYSPMSPPDAKEYGPFAGMLIPHAVTKKG